MANKKNDIQKSTDKQSNIPCPGYGYNKVDIMLFKHEAKDSITEKEIKF